MQSIEEQPATHEYSEPQAIAWPRPGIAGTSRRAAVTAGIVGQEPLRGVECGQERLHFLAQRRIIGARVAEKCSPLRHGKLRRAVENLAHVCIRVRGGAACLPVF